MTVTNMEDISSIEAVTRRPATDADLDFLRAVYESTRAAELALVNWSEEQKRDFLDMQFHAQHKFYHENFPDAEYDILELDGNPVGRIYIDRRPTEIRLIDIALLPEYQNRRIGSSLILKLMEDSTKAKLPITLHVEVFNRAQELYHRLDFKRIRDDGLYIFMEWTPS